MSLAKKSICASITNHVQLSGFRDIVEAHGRDRGLKGMVFNDVDGSVKVMACGTEQAINDFIQDLRITRPDTLIETKEIKDDIPLPAPFGRVVTDEIREMSERFDEGIKILSSMDKKLDKLDALEKLDTLDNVSIKLGVLGDKLDTLPERIAKALKS